MIYKQLLSNPVSEFLTLCPHCLRLEESGIVQRYSESFPFIGRSDGETFHLVLADRPRPFPAEKNLETHGQVSLGFRYSHRLNCNKVCVTTVILPRSRPYSIYRTIEYIADALAEELYKRGLLSALYEVGGWSEDA